MEPLAQIGSITTIATLTLGVAPSAHAQRASLDTLETRAERTAYVETSRYDDVMQFVRTVAAASPNMHLTTFGYTHEGRALPLVVVGRVAGPSAAQVRATGKTRVFIQANIHAGEVCGKEAMLMMLRDLAQGRHAEWLDSLVLLIAPIYNADGNERVTLTNRPGQHGPIGGMGQRPNAQGYDLNRDHVKLDSPEARSLVGFMAAYDPHVGIDLHTTNGSRHAYHLTYAPPLNPNTDARILRLLKEEWLPAAGRHLQSVTGWRSDYYGNSGRPVEGVRGWRTFDHRPRFNNNYVGLRNRFAILSEAYSYATFEERVIATLRFVEGSVDFAARNASRIRAITAAVDATDLTGHQLAVQAEIHRGGIIEILMGETDEVTNPYSGARMLLRRDTVIPERMYDATTFAPTERELMPAAYLVPPEARDAIQKLREHGVEMRPVGRPRTIRAQEFHIDSTRTAEREFQGHHERTIFGAYREAEVAVATGWMIISTRQPLGRLVFTLLEPRSDDGFANWNVLDPLLERATVYAIRRTVTPVQ